MGEIHTLRVKSPYKLMNIVDIKTKNKPNEHGCATRCNMKSIA